MQSQLAKQANSDNIDGDDAYNPYIITQNQILERIIANEQKNKEFQKQTTKLRKNPTEFRNFCKSYIVIRLLSEMMLIKRVTEDEIVIAKLLSRFELDELNILDQKMHDESIELEVKLKSLSNYF